MRHNREWFYNTILHQHVVFWVLWCIMIIMMYSEYYDVSIMNDVPD